MSMEALTTWYERQSPRDQRVLQIGAVAVAIILLAALYLMPQRALDKARTTLETRRELLTYMRQVGPSLVASGAGVEVQPITESFIVFIDRTAREHGLGDAITGSPPGTIKRYIADYQEGLKLNDFTSYCGMELGPKELARLHGTWQRVYGEGEQGG